MKFTVKKVEAIYTGGGIFAYCGITEDGFHFIACDDPIRWVMLTESDTMTTELSDTAWNDMWFEEWQNANAYYSTTTEAEADRWLAVIYKAILKDSSQSHFHSDMQKRLNTITVY